jgi:murein DD-endopeptidase MepM/ murein hydrolase activator NlpD
VKELMAFKRLTIVFVPEGTSGTRQFSLPKVVLCALVLCLLGGGVYFGWIFQDYVNLKGKMPRLAQLEKENQFQKSQFLHLAQRINKMTKRVGELEAVDHRLRTMVNMETGEDNTPSNGVGGPDPALLDPRQAAEKSVGALVRKMHRSLDDLSDGIAYGKREKAELEKFLEEQKTLLASTPSIWPTKGWLSSGFGYRTSPFTGQREFHKGLDISARLKAPILAPANGIVRFVGWDHGYGKSIIISHGHGIKTRYAHLQKALVKKGQYVKRGDTIALVGSTGRSTGPHLHYEVHVNGMAVNPLRYILN